MGSSGKQGTTVRATIEDYQLPLKYRRQPLDEKEIEYINVSLRTSAGVVSFGMLSCIGIMTSKIFYFSARRS